MSAAVLLDRLANPMLVKELRAGLRGARWFIVLVTILSLLAIVLLLTLGALHAAHDPTDDPTEIGQDAFLIVQSLLVSSAFLVVPGFAATAVTSERDRQTIDILLSTSLTPGQIAWGKLLCAVAQSFVIYIAALPLIALTGYYGGVTLTQMVANYVLILLLTVFMSSWALSISASVQSTTRAVIGIYAGAIAMGTAGWILAAILFDAGVLHHYMEGWGFMTGDLRDFTRWSRAVTWGRWQVFLYVFLIPLSVIGLVGSLFYLNAVSRLKPFRAERSRAFRLYYLVAGPLLLVLAACTFYTDFVNSPADERLAFLGVLAGLVLVLGSLSTQFALEDPVLPRHIRRRYEAPTRLPTFRRLLAPGARPGARFVLVSNVGLLVLVLLVAIANCAEFDRGTWRDYGPLMPVFLGLLSVGVWIYFLCGLAACFSIWLRGRPIVQRILLIVVAFAMILLPLFHWMFDSQMNSPWRHGTYNPVESAAPITLAFSPAATLWSAFRIDHPPYEVPLYVRLFGATIPLHAAFFVLLGIGGAVLRSIAGRRIRELEAREDA